jgi:uncharacterized membrane protein
VGLVLVGAPALASYARVGGRARRADRIVLGAVRGLALLLLAFCLLRPTLVLSSAVPQRNFLAILLDDSRSMRVPDADRDAGGEAESRTRGEVARTLFARDSALARALGERFQLRWFRFSGAAERVDGAEALTFDGRRSRLAGAVRRAREELAQVPLAGIVLVTDGVDNTPDTMPADAALDAAADGTPLFAVGLGRERLEPDVEVAAVSAPRSALAGAVMALDVQLQQSGFAGRTVRVQAEEGGRILGAREVKLGADGTVTPVHLLVPAPEPGPRLLAVRVAPIEGELVRENNAREALVEVKRTREKILYLEGEPRFEFKFLRRAVADDPTLQLVAVQRTAEQKFLRLGVDDSLELVTGFPRTREELFSYRAVVLGSVEASFFTAEQLRMLADFVSRRGGGLLALGGRRALGEGGFGGTALAEALPVALAKEAPSGDSAPAVELRMRPTAAGAEHAALQLAGDEKASAERWRALPPLTGVNAVGAPKPGATVLLEGEGEGGRRPALVWQRYGRGKAIALLVQDSWLWQMHAEMAVDDQTHETFWRQLLRWLASDAPDPLTAELPDRAAPGEPLPLVAEARDARHEPINDAAVVARVTAPSGAVTEVPLAWNVARDGEYRGAHVPTESGLHTVTVRRGPAAAGDSLGVTLAEAHVQVAEGDDELTGAALRADLLRRLAERSGGRYYTPASARTLPEDVAVSGAGVTVREARDLWNMPIVFLLLLTLLAAEWGWRRWRGLA